ncbi:uncharacterized protein LOC129616781 [Condylostylus longicornis]|uniref:uncharacterized protein LOC129616781 n=1 Tax=Condylostylus longicornis TaxID=2530218 RepID=UPI00244E45DA|nr:uncharacterized protein LOC129616781 [Condylostylus longicornis]
MLRSKTCTFYFKYFVFVSTFQFIYCNFCIMRGSCKCQIKNLTKSTLTFPENGLPFQYDSNIINICETSKSITTNSVASSNLKYEVTCDSLVKENRSNSEIHKPLHFILQKDTNLFTLVLQYPCDAPPNEIKGYSTGSVLVIIFFTLCFVYLGLGVSVNFCLVGARGIEMMPNLDFWKDFPALVLDGVKFLQNGCTAGPSDLSTPSGAEGYDAI